MQLWLHYWRKAVPKPRLFCGNGEQPKFAVYPILHQHLVTFEK
ncbi:hypothetical protein [Rubritalea tangerina]